MKKVVVVMPCWKRADVVQTVSNQLDLFYNATKNKIELTVLWVFSIEDLEIDQLFSVYLKAGHKRDCLFSGNKLLGKKLNDAITYADKFEYDYIMNFGSDDLIHPAIIDLYQDSMRKELDVFGLNNVFFYHPDADPILFSYYNKPNIVGAGRMIHRRVIKLVQLNYQEGLYKIDLCRGMDTFSATRMAGLRVQQTVIDGGEFPYIVDIKSDVNINSFNSILEHSITGSIKPYSRQYITDKFEVLNP